MAAMPETLAPSIVEVPLLDLKAQYESIEKEVTVVMLETCASQRFILGPKVDELEKKIAAYSQCQYGIGVSSGTDALLVALMALDVGPGDTCRLAELDGGVVGQTDADAGPGDHGEPRAIPAADSFASPDVRLADMREGERDDVSGPWIGSRRRVDRFGEGVRDRGLRRGCRRRTGGVGRRGRGCR